MEGVEVVEWWRKLIKLEGYELFSINEGNCMGDHNPFDFVQAKQKSGRQMGQVEGGSPNRTCSPAALIIHRDVPLPFSQTPRHGYSGEETEEEETERLTRG